jgi:16S rRNA (uracil1498-N3)-methyltransferase
MRRRFFVERFDGRRATLGGEAAHHLGRVLRAEAGQRYELSDGRAVWLAEITRVGRDAVEFALLEPVAALAPALATTLLVAVVKFDRFEWALEKATELGAARIVPLAAARSERGLLAAAAKRAARWRKILFEAAQQARRLAPPELAPLAGPADAFAAAREPVRVLFSERDDAPPLSRALSDVGANFSSPRLGGAAVERGEPKFAPAESQPERAAAVAIGPEGGWTDDELAAARAASFAEASLGPLVLRTETAVAAALASINFALSLER